MLSRFLIARKSGGNGLKVLLAPFSHLLYSPTLSLLMRVSFSSFPIARAPTRAPAPPPFFSNLPAVFFLRLSAVQTSRHFIIAVARGAERARDKSGLERAGGRARGAIVEMENGKKKELLQEASVRVRPCPSPPHSVAAADKR